MLVAQGYSICTKGDFLSIDFEMEAIIIGIKERNLNSVSFADGKRRSYQSGLMVLLVTDILELFDERIVC